MALTSSETDSPLIVDSDRMLATSIATQGLQLMAGWRGQNSEFCGGMGLEQFP